MSQRFNMSQVYFVLFHNIVENEPVFILSGSFAMTTCDVRSLDGRTGLKLFPKFKFPVSFMIDSLIAISLLSSTCDQLRYSVETLGTILKYIPFLYPSSDRSATISSLTPSPSRSQVLHNT